MTRHCMVWLRRAVMALLCLSSIHAKAETARHDMVAAANPLAAAAGREILRHGGNAIDAVIATQLVLNLVEPESSGLGGGALLVYWSAQERRVVTFDGRETAPLAAKPDRFLGADGKPLAFYDAVVGGISVGVPGVLRMLELAHRRYGKLPWQRLFAPAIALAEQGFPLSPRLREALASDPYLPRNPAAQLLYYAPDGSAKPVGSQITNPELAATLRLIAEHGVSDFYQGGIAQDIVAAVTAAPNHPGDLTTADLAAYQAKERPAVCGTYRRYRICGMGPPSSGGVALLQILDLLLPFDLPRQKATVEAWHLFLEASRLAYADRDRYLADPDFVSVPVDGLIDRHYLAGRAALIDRERAHQGPAQPGDPPGRHAEDSGDDASPEFPSTSNIAIIDRDGDALDMTTTIENSFGSRLIAHGFLLNNELTDFSFLPERDGKPVANRVEGGKRPRSSMSPTLIFDRDGKLVLVVGSAGGNPIITDVAKTVLAVLDWGYGVQQAIDLPNLGNRNGASEIEAGPAGDALAKALAPRGHELRMSTRPSGLSGIKVTPHGFEGAADKRREGAALGD